MADTTYDLALSDQRPFFETALRHGVRQAIIPSSKLTAMQSEAPKGIVQIATAFGSPYLRPEIEAARKRIVNLASLYLIETSGGELDVAAKLIRDNTFLTLSRGGSGLLKALFALPEYALLGRATKGPVEDFLEVWSLRDKPFDYRQALKQRRLNALEIEAGFWFGEFLGATREQLREEDVEASSVVRSGLLLLIYGNDETRLDNQVEFATLLETIRNLPAIRRKQALATVDLSDIPAAFAELVASMLAEIKAHDLPLLQDKKIPLDKLVFALKDQYYFGHHDIDDTSAYDALVSKEWTRLTKGQTDVDSLMTLFLCIAAGVAPKTSISERAAKALVKQLREQGFEPARTSAWIAASAPHEKQEGLLEDWNNFIEEANNYLLDDWDVNYSGAMRFLSLHCHLLRAAK
ncbi:MULTISPECIES: hypothetical protein [unclassified Undibacterium]|uniref:hypothetical protein n=1 Tax=unclassified Undibacterium TaxID=2630295 RepID=UPI002AC98956|nr:MULTISPECIES: hypothetical protein [unclassified Undibacterium]MEB0138596.1 hypothetical protein [Undibacterium sp. CCC2.1]MEB0171340.1 hypothetical protein [Undibacterium sp. CCC1.1]MEB0175360.1 hypothetical protein [Undibacterium sp. CCC3.4]MEB0214536.1 hypothetical protein [Undibacterium sp. 5I2]WPX43090.1 hypothetical protein RHM61_17170 [Undibacterium sp. CCC3.4]